MPGILGAILLSAIGVGELPSDTAVVCPASLRGALEPWVRFRQAQGHVVAFVSAEQSPGEIKQRLRELHAQNSRLAILLVGDAPPLGTAVEASCLPTHYCEAKVNVVFGSEPEIATDNWYADFDDDGVPESAVGRLPVDTPEELSRLVRRIVDYEQSHDFGPWRRRINFVAGVGNFGALADAALESVTKRMLTSQLPPAFETTMTYGSWQSPYCPGPPQFRQACLDRYNEGCLMWVYIGHGSRREVDRLYAPDGAYPILTSRDVGSLTASRPPLALFLSCYSGAFDGVEDCLAEEMLRSEGGPVGVLCGSRVTMPYAMALLSQELMTGFFDERQATVGALLLDAKRGMVLNPRDGDEARQLDAMAVTIMPMAADLKAQCREHCQLFNLLGDPLLRLRQPEAARVHVAAEAQAGRMLAVRGESPIEGRVTVELVVRRDRLTFRPEQRLDYNVAADGLAEFAATYSRANDSRLAVVVGSVTAGAFTTEVAVPESARGDCHVRVYVEGRESFAVGSADVRIAAGNASPAAR